MFSKLLKYLIIFFLFIMITILGINFIVVITTKGQILTQEEFNQIDDIDCILILGAGIRGNNPSPMLEDRLKQGIALYNAKTAPKIIVSGDHMKENYDEVNVMKDYLVGHKIPSQDVFMDHAGISTYDSIYRAKYIFKVEKMVIVTQKYHLHRALYIANQLGIEAYGLSADLREYIFQSKRDVREVFARVKDFLQSIIKPTSTYLGDEIPIQGNGDITND